MNRPTEQEKAAMRARYAPVAKPKAIAQDFKVRSCGQVVHVGPVGLCWWFIKRNGLNAKPSLK